MKTRGEREHLCLSTHSTPSKKICEYKQHFWHIYVTMIYLQCSQAVSLCARRDTMWRTLQRHAAKRRKNVAHQCMTRRASKQCATSRCAPWTRCALQCDHTPKSFCTSGPGPADSAPEWASAWASVRRWRGRTRGSTRPPRGWWRRASRSAPGGWGARAWPGRATPRLSRPCPAILHTTPQRLFRPKSINT